MKLSEMLRTIKENPDDLSTIGDIIAKAEELEQNDTQYVETIGKLQENNRKLVKMIPVPGDDPKPEKEEKSVTVEDAVKEIREQFKGGNE